MTPAEVRSALRLPLSPAQRAVYEAVRFTSAEVANATVRDHANAAWRREIRATVRP